MSNRTQKKLLQNNPIKIRLANLSDLDALIFLENASFSTDKISKRSLRELLKKESAHVFVAEMENKIIGSAILLYRKNSTTARIYSLAIHSEYRRFGVASILSTALEKYAATRHCNRMILEVRLDNQAAIEFYKKHGYHHFGSYQQFYEDGTAAYRMEKHL